MERRPRVATRKSWESQEASLESPGAMTTIRYHVHLGKATDSRRTLPCSASSVSTASPPAGNSSHCEGRHEPCRVHVPPSPLVRNAEQRKRVGLSSALSSETWRRSRQSPSTSSIGMTSGEPPQCSAYCPAGRELHAQYPSLRRESQQSPHPLHSRARVAANVRYR
jgi:hypothetical protein